MTQVLYMIDSLWGRGGAELALAKIARELPKDQYQCRVICFNGDKIGCSLFESSGIKVHYWPLSNLYGPKAFRTASLIRQLVKRENIDLVHTFFPVSDLWAGPIAKLSGAKCLISSRRDMGILRRGWHHWAYRLISPMYDQVQAVSESVRQHTIEVDGIAADRVITCPNGIDPEPNIYSQDDVAALTSQAKLEPEHMVVTCVANWRKVKGIDILVEAAAKIAKTHPHVRFLVAGDFGRSPADLAFTQAVMATADKVGAGNYASFLGGINCIPALLSLSDIFVLPSRSEGMSNALLEAMKAGLPCVATDVGGNPEVVLDGVTGFIIPSEDPQALADKLLLLIDDKALYQSMSAAGKARILSDFNYETVIARVTESYENLLGISTAKVNENRVPSSV